MSNDLPYAAFELYVWNPSNFARRRGVKLSKFGEGRDVFALPSKKVDQNVVAFSDEPSCNTNAKSAALFRYDKPGPCVDLHGSIRVGEVEEETQAFATFGGCERPKS